MSFLKMRKLRFRKGQEPESASCSQRLRAIVSSQGLVSHGSPFGGKYTALPLSSVGQTYCNATKWKGITSESPWWAQRQTNRQPHLSMSCFQGDWFSINGRSVIFRDQFALKVALGHMFSVGSWNPCSLRGSLLAGAHGLKCFLGLFWSRGFKRAFHLHPKAQSWLLSAHRPLKQRGNLRIWDTKGLLWCSHG